MPQRWMPLWDSGWRPGSGCKLSARSGPGARRAVAVDGKAVRGTRHASSDGQAVHLLAALDQFTSRTGRPSLPADLVGRVLVSQALYDLSDGQAAEALRSGIRWKVACGRSLTQMSFDPSTLVYWRRRIAGSSRPGRVV